MNQPSKTDLQSGSAFISARIYQPAKTCTQAGLGKRGKWLLEFLARTSPKIDSLMGWTSQGDPLSQVKLWFDTLEAAVEYAKGKNFLFFVDPPAHRKRQKASYTDNFLPSRRELWTH